MTDSLHDKKFGYRDGDSVIQWEIKDIWDAVEGEPVTLRSISLFRSQLNSVQKHYTKRDFLRIEKADLDYPVIISESNLIIDGYHRLAKLEKMGMITADCVVLKEMPKPSFVKGKPFEITGMPKFVWEKP